MLNAKLIRFAIVLFCLMSFVSAYAVMPPPDGDKLPEHVYNAQKEISKYYGTSGIAMRLQEIKAEKEQAIKAGTTYRHPVTNVSVPVLLGDYSNVNHLFGTANYQTLLFGANPTGSMTDYYDEVSYSEFNLTGTVYGPFTAAQTQAYYENGDNGLGNDFPTNATGFITSILNAADPTIDFRPFDNDGPDGVPNSGDDDGFVDILIVIFPDGDASGGDNDNIWAHQWELRYGGGGIFITNDPSASGGNIQIDVYTIQGGEQGDGTWNLIKPIGVFCHEFGHAIGLPDMYDTDGSSGGVGTWCLMGGGSWGVNSNSTTEDRPVHMNAWCKSDLGWIIPSGVVGTRDVQIPPVETNPVAYKLWDDAYQGGRFFLLENRTQTGFDGAIFGEGVLIWHCNEEVCFDNSDDNFRLVRLEEADGLNQVFNDVNNMDAGDLYPGSTNNVLFNDFTNPNANDVFGNPTGVVAQNFAYVAGPGSDVSVTLVQRNLLGYTIALHGHTNMQGWGTMAATLCYGAVRFTAPYEGTLISVRAGVHETTPVPYSIRIYNNIVAGSPVGLQSTTNGNLPNFASDRYFEIPLSASMNLADGQTFLVDIAWGPDDYAVPFSFRRPISGESFFSQDGINYTNWTDKDILIRAVVETSIHHYVILVDRSGSMDLDFSPGRTRFEEAIDRALADVAAIFADPLRPNPEVAVISFTTTGGGNYNLELDFNGTQLTVETAINNIAVPGNLTPLAEAMIESADRVFAAAPFGIRNVYVYTDGYENASIHNSASPVCGYCNTYLTSPPNVGGDWNYDCDPNNPAFPCTDYQLCLADALANNGIINVRYFGDPIAKSGAFADGDTKSYKSDLIDAALYGDDINPDKIPQPLPDDYAFLKAVAENSGGFFSYESRSPNYVIRIEKTHNTLQGHYEYVSITLENGPLEMGGFDFLIAYDASALAFMEATPGQLLEDCGWEYFTYRYGVHGNCGDACPSGLLRIVAMAETNDGPNHPSCFGPPDADPHELARMKFYVTDDRTYECQYTPIYFFWDDCGDNMISTMDGDTVYIDAAIYDFEENLIWNEEDDDQFPEDARIPFVGAPDYCLNPDPEKPSAIRRIDFVHGGIDIVCGDSIDLKCDLNLDDIPYTIADAVMYVNYFIYGPSAFIINFNGQIAASDCNGDGRVLTVADLVYLIRVITGSAFPDPKMIPGTNMAEVNLLVNHSAAAVSVNSPVDVGAVQFVIEHAGYDIGEPHLINGAMDMTLKYSDQDGVLTVLVYSMEKDIRISSRQENIFVIPISGEGEMAIGEVQLSDYNGNVLNSTIVKETALPTRFALHQSYPNPFNANTQIVYELPHQSRIKIEVFNVRGQKVAELFDGEESAGVHRVEWNGTDDYGNDVASGVYFYRLTTPDFKSEKKMLLMK